MGTDVPPGFPVIEDDKWYCCTVDSYEVTGPPGDCLGAYIRRQSCCQRGDSIINFLANRECKFQGILCGFPELSNQRLVDLVGPYVNQAACEAVCGV